MRAMGIQIDAHISTVSTLQGEIEALRNQRNLLERTYAELFSLAQVEKNTVAQLGAIRNNLIHELQTLQERHQLLEGETKQLYAILDVLESDYQKRLNSNDLSAMVSKAIAAKQRLREEEIKRQSLEDLPF